MWDGRATADEWLDCVTLGSSCETKLKLSCSNVRVLWCRYSGNTHPHLKPRVTPQTPWWPGYGMPEFLS